MPPRKSKPTRKITRRQKSSRQERRRSPRVETKLLTMFRERERDERAVSFVRTLNLSSTGALIESADPLRVGQLVHVEILLDFNRVVNVQARVVHLNAQAEGFIFAGLKFHKLDKGAKQLLKEQVSP